MFLISKLHAAGVSHGQLYEGDRRRHIISAKQGLRIVDFSESVIHSCVLTERASRKLGRLPVHATAPCEELQYMQDTIGSNGRVSNRPPPHHPSAQQYLTVPTVLF